MPDTEFPGTNSPGDRKVERKRMRQARSAFVGALAAQTRHALQSAACAALLPHLGPPAVLASYAAVGDELDPSTAERAAQALGWRIVFPRASPGAPLSFHAVPRDRLTPGRLGIPEPGPDSPQARPDVLLVPLIAADRAGNRLGQGGGFYDRSLAALRASGPVMAIGLAWDIQIVDHVPAEPWDQPIDAIATPSAFHLAGPGARGEG